MPFSQGRTSTRKRTRTRYTDLASDADSEIVQENTTSLDTPRTCKENHIAPQAPASIAETPLFVPLHEDDLREYAPDHANFGHREEQHGAPSMPPANGPMEAEFASEMPKVSTQKRPKGKKLQAGKADTLLNYLGSHVDISRAMVGRQVWLDQLYGPVAASLAKFDRALSFPLVHDALKNKSYQITYEQSDADALPYVPVSQITQVQFINPSTLEPISRTLKTFDVHDFTTVEPGCRSFTIFSGLANHAVSWAPTSPETQYLAVGGTASDVKPTPLFTVEQGPASIQIWQVVARGPARSCKLCAIVAHDFGPSWQLKWCPALSIDSAVIGWIAGLFGDGSVRVWPVPSSAAQGQQIPYHKLVEPAFSLRLPESACVSFDWVSDVRIIVGCANGFSAMWDLSTDAQIPFVVGQAHITYINNTVSCGPSIAEGVLTTGWDCEVKMSNIRAMESDFLFASKERTPVYAATWCDMLNGAVVGEDLHSVRVVSYRTGVSTSICSMVGTVTALACHASHPFLAIGDASGCVKITNLYRKILSKKMDQFQRKIYQIDYATKEDKYRFTENFKPEPMPGILSSGQTPVTNIYPREISINSLAWNGNRGYEGLLASCSTKFVRIDDLTAGL